MRLFTLALILGTLSFAAERAPMTANFPDSAPYRWLNKSVLESRVLDEMKSLDKWTAINAEMTLTRERSRNGGQSLRLRTPTRLNLPGPDTGRGWGSAGVRRRFDGEDWRSFNRLSLWIYPDCPGTYVITVSVRVTAEKLPAALGSASGSTVLRNHQWNHVLWELDNMAPRDKVTSLEITRAMNGNEPEEADSVTFDLDRLELERVEPDYIEGWSVWPGRISYSHTGYQAGATKSAIASGLNAREFRLIDQATGQAVLSKPIETVKTQLGAFQVMDFSEVRQAGSYVLQAGGTVTHPFRIDPNVWRQTIWKALNFFYAERCGMAIPGVHGVCHRDWQVAHGDKRITINGGWHDAGDLTQSAKQTAENAYAMFSLAERLNARGDDPELYQRVLEEAEWGLAYVLKTSFGDGYRNAGSVNGRKTDGIVGDFDDPTIPQARNVPMENFAASAVEAIAYRVLKARDPRIAAYSLKMAEADWRFAVAGMASSDTPWTGARTFQDIWRVTFDSENVVHEVASTGVLASVNLWRATGGQRYADKAAELGRMILESQQRQRLGWEIPLTGFFFSSPAKDYVVHYVHRGREQGPGLALRELCEAFPNHPDWMKWYSAVVLHSEYLKSMAKYTEPYGVLPASIYQDDEYLSVPERIRESFRKQVLNGIPLGAGHYLRVFPATDDLYRGHFGTVLSQTLALAQTAHLRGDLEAAQLAQRQLEWVIGRNPFAQSTMWGEGYDFPPYASSSSGNMVGGLPVGIQTRGDSDVPYWPIHTYATYKEVWNHPVGRWIWLMRDLAGPALVEGQAGATVEFQDIAYGQRIEVKPVLANGRFRAMLPEGKYRVRCQGEEQTRTFLPGATYELDLRPGRGVDFAVSGSSSSTGEVTIKVSARGSGSHRFALRTDNLTAGGAERELTLRSGVAGTVEWRVRIASADTAWVAVVVPDDDLSLRKEVQGAAWEH
jgi:hypothetical protein